tara:strand:- start:122 stop:238 length:117 start_codon:yes stop_codon:yes gene_type:complete
MKKTKIIIIKSKDSDVLELFLVTLKEVAKDMKVIVTDG